MGKKNAPLVIFHKELATNILKAFGKAVDENDYLVEIDTGQKVLSPEGEEILLKEFAGVAKGSEIYLKSDITSLINFLEKRKWAGNSG